MTVALPNWTIEDDRRVIAEVNEIARQQIIAEHGYDVGEGNRCDMGFGATFRVGVTILNYWRRACADYKKLHDIEPHECLARHEADIRSHKNAHELHVERR
jgi:hypothetical protein